MRRKLLYLVYLVIGLALLFLFLLPGKSRSLLSGGKSGIHTSLQMLPPLTYQAIKNAADTLAPYTIVNLFDPDCDHCQHFATAVYDNKQHFKNARLIMVCRARQEKVKFFLEQYHLDSLPFVSAGSDTAGILFKTFNVATVPSVYVYDRQKQLAGSQVGETDIKNLLQVINR